MQQLIVWSGYLSASAGIGVCLLAGVLRLAGVFTLPLVDTGTLFMLGMGLMLVGSLALQVRILQKLP